ncbi:protein white-like protein [Anopheles sinensis]|uniref:Protein white-like protein n=1 Tax=Anopheles sinensis TaxID=74873 RepID=A0A084W5G3_ANOSI|nr:protein white-like protein [Anopheles sinensis]
MESYIKLSDRAQWNLQKNRDPAPNSYKTGVSFPGEEDHCKERCSASILFMFRAPPECLVLVVIVGIRQLLSPATATEARIRS